MVGYNLYACRYNPERDTGEGNMCYILNNSSATSLEPPSNKTLYLKDFHYTYYYGAGQTF